MQMFIFPFKICRPLAFFSYLILNIDRMKKYPNKKGREHESIYLIIRTILKEMKT